MSLDNAGLEDEEQDQETDYGKYWFWNTNLLGFSLKV